MEVKRVITLTGSHFKKEGVLPEGGTLEVKVRIVNNPLYNTEVDQKVRDELDSEVDQKIIDKIRNIIEEYFSLCQENREIRVTEPEK